MADLPTLPTLVDLNGSEKLVNPDGTPSPYFLRYLLDRGGYLSQVDQVIAQLGTLQVQAGAGLDVSPSPGLLTENPTLSLEPISPDPSGSYTNLDATINEYGQVVTAANGSGGGTIFTELFTPGGSTSIPNGPGLGTVIPGASLVIPASGAVRTAVLSANFCTFDTVTSTSIIMMHVILDGVFVTLTACDFLFDGGTNFGFTVTNSGVVMTIPGDGASHTIELGLIYAGGALTATVTTAYGSMAVWTA